MVVTHFRYDGICPPGIVAAFSLKSFWLDRQYLESMQFRREFVHSLGFDHNPVATAGQIHSSKVLAVDRGGYYAGADGIATNRPGLFLAVVTADCLPVFMWDMHAGCIALIHAGWRGSDAQIVKQGIALMVAQYGSIAQDIGALLGPSICAGCYEVGLEVAEKFEAGDSAKGSNGHFYLDLRAANRRQLLESGILPENIATDPLCTRCRSDILCSYRAEGAHVGRLVAALGIKE
jgi:YfiH family protein